MEHVDLNPPHVEMEMHNTRRRLAVPLAFFCMAALLQACGNRSSASTSQDHVRGTVQSLDGRLLTVATSTGSVRVELAASTRVATVVQSDRAHLTNGSFLGITSVTQPDGTT
jgi:ABC-type enterochelin transport system substrate-binding protein